MVNPLFKGPGLCPVCGEDVPAPPANRPARLHICPGKRVGPAKPAAVAPCYPHVADDTIPKTLTVVDHPTANTVSDIPPLGDLVGNVDALLKSANVTASSAINLASPGVIMVICNCVFDVPKGGIERAEVLNGSLKHPELVRVHAQWVSSNEQWLKAQRNMTGPDKKMNEADPHFLYGTEGSVSGSALTPANGGSTNGQWDKVKKRIMINAHVEKGGMLVHEYLHTFDRWEPTDIGWGFDEGIVEFIARDLTARHGYKYVGNWAYQGGYLAAKGVVDRLGYDKVLKFWFERDSTLMGLVSAKAKAIGTHVVPGEKWDHTDAMIQEFCDAALTWPGFR